MITWLATCSSTYGGRIPNSGPITSLSAHAPSCTETLTFTAGTVDGDSNELYVGHHGNPVSTDCYPRGTPEAPPLNDEEAWRVYYCQFHRLATVSVSLAYSNVFVQIAQRYVLLAGQQPRRSAPQSRIQDAATHNHLAPKRLLRCAALRTFVSPTCIFNY